MTFGVGAPKRRTTYVLKKTQADSGVYQLLVEICAGDFPSSDIQLALWIVGNKLSWGEFYRGPTYLTFDSQNIGTRHSKGAADIIIKAGMDPKTSTYFGGKGEPTRLKPPEIPVIEEPIKTLPGDISS